jgi:opacity protein-like surface antigen
MKTQLLCGAAAGAITAALAGPGLAADMPVKAARQAAPAMIPQYNWTGWYIGGHVGWGRTKYKGIWFGDTATRETNQNLDGFLGGLQLGYDQHLSNNIIVGLVGDLSFMKFKADQLHGSTAGIDTLDAKLKMLASLRANLGLLLAERTELFVTGGLGYARGDAQFRDTGPKKDEDLTKWGGVVGGGLRYAFTDNLIVGIEGLYYIFKAHEHFNGPTDDGSAELKNATVVRVTLDWKFK